MRYFLRGCLMSIALVAIATQAHAGSFSTSAVSPTAVPANGVIEGNYPAGQSDTSYYFVANLKAGQLATQISVNGGAQYKSLDFSLLDGSGRRIDAYYITAGAGDNSEATRVFPIDASGKYLVRLTNKGPETTSFRVALGAMMPRNRPTPADIASLRFRGIELMMYSRMRKIEIRKKITPEQNTAASACCQVYFIVSTTVKAKNALSPMPGASAIG
jgi:hypothetical protein